ncbi:hypothetical protein [Methanocella arvoryzae]|nr:hypothetical protein [Methanocella arvoryzae]
MVNIPHRILGHRWDSWDNLLLALAIFIDVADFIPFNLPVSAIEAVFLMYLGVAPSRTIIAGIIDFIPIVHFFPWCTLAVLHMRYGVNLGGLSKLFKEEKPQAGHERYHAGSI